MTCTNGSRPRASAGGGSTYQELIDTPRAASLFEPQLSVLAALNQLAAGQRDAAAETMRSLIKRSPSAEVALAGNATLLPSADADLVAWLTQYVGEPWA